MIQTIWGHASRMTLKVGSRYRSRDGRETTELWWSIYTKPPFEFAGYFIGDAEPGENERGDGPDWARLWSADGSAIWFRDEDLVEEI